MKRILPPILRGCALYSPLLALLASCATDGESAGGNSMETENTLYARILGSDGQPASGSIATLCQAETPVCASGALATDTVNAEGYIQFALPATGSYTVLILNGTDSLAIAATVSGTETKIDLGEWSTATRSPLTDTLVYLPDSGVVVLNPQDTAFTLSPVAGPSVATGTSQQFAHLAWNLSTALTPLDNGALLVGHSETEAYKSYSFLTLTRLDLNGAPQAARGYEYLGRSRNSILVVVNESRAIALPSGNIVIASTARMGNEINEQVWMAEFNSALQLQWARLYRDKNAHRSITGLGVDAQGNLYVSGAQGASLTDSLQPFLLRVDPQGEWLGDHRYGRLATNRSTRVIDASTASDGTTLQIVNSTAPSYNGLVRYGTFLRRLGADGALLGETALDLYASYSALGQTQNGGTRMIAVDSYDAKTYVLDVAASGTVDTLSILAMTINVMDYQELATGGGIAVGETYEKISDNPLRYSTQAQMLRVSAGGDSLWTETLGDSANSEEYQVAAPLADGSLLVAGRVQTGDDYDNIPVWIRKRAAD